MNGYVADWSYGLIKTPLLKPYNLSFTTVREIDTIWVSVLDHNGHYGVGEAVPLPGYGSETTELIVDFLQAGRWKDSTRKEIIEELSPSLQSNPFAISALTTALEWSIRTEAIDRLKPVSIVYPVAVSPDFSEMESEMRQGKLLGYTHFKIKTGRNLQDDIKQCRQLLTRCREHHYTFRFDANQAYTLDQAKEFAQSLLDEGHGNYLWLEQPLDQKDWTGMEQLCRDIRFPFMLDESIYDSEDVKRAHAIGCRAIKLKLFKHLGISHCVALAELATELGMLVTIGNGVSSDIANLAEMIAVSENPRLFVEGSECNGFLKLSGNIAFPDLIGKNGCIEWKRTGTINSADVIAHLKRSSLWWSQGQ